MNKEKYREFREKKANLQKIYFQISLRKFFVSVLTVSENNDCVFLLTCIDIFFHFILGIFFCTDQTNHPALPRYRWLCQILRGLERFVTQKKMEKNRHPWNMAQTIILRVSRFFFFSFVLSHPSIDDGLWFCGCEVGVKMDFISEKGKEGLTDSPCSFYCEFKRHRLGNKAFWKT